MEVLMKSTERNSKADQKESNSTPEEAVSEYEKLAQSLSNHKIELEVQQQELERTLAELEHARRKFDEIRDNAPVAYFTHALNGLVIEINKRARQLAEMVSSYLSFT
jgi:DNA-directed RNA polymerase subunit H (RpoH/RPB5)